MLLKYLEVIPDRRWLDTVLFVFVQIIFETVVYFMFYCVTNGLGPMKFLLENIFLKFDCLTTNILEN